MDEMNPFASAALSVAQNNAWSAEQAQKQMDFQERMSNTAHVREIADLKAAGLNPVLSAKLGGASTPSGAMATGDMSGTSAIVSLFDRMLDNQSAEKLLQMRLDNSNEQLEKKFDFEREMTAMNNAVAAAESAGKASSGSSGSSGSKSISSASGIAETIKDVSLATIGNAVSKVVGKDASKAVVNYLDSNIETDPVKRGENTLKRFNNNAAGTFDLYNRLKNSLSSVFGNSARSVSSGSRTFGKF